MIRSSSSVICFLQEINDHHAAGGKARGLAKLHAAGFRVPEGFVATPEATPNAIAVAYRRLGAGRVAVRSSAEEEDSGERSYAGQFDTFLNVSGEEQVFEAVNAWWAVTAAAAVARIGRRRAHHRRMLIWPPPPRLLAELPDGRLAPYEVDPGGDTLHGFGASPGRVTGRACVVRDLHEAAALKPGEILVTRTTDIAWTPLFRLAAAVVTEIGAPTSHAAIVARELGVPAVVNVGHVTDRVRNDDELFVDGWAGLVRRNVAAGMSALAQTTGE